MRNFILSAEAACDLTPELAQKYGVKITPMKYYIDGEEYSSDDGKLTTVDICEKMKNGAKTATTQINPSEAEEYLESLLKEGKDVLHLSFSSAMSGTYANFAAAAEKLNKTHDNKIYVVDTLCQSGGDGLIVTMVAEKSDNDNLDAVEARDYAESVKLHIVHYFTVDTFTYLARGGRIPAYLATIGNVIKLKPVMHLVNEGKIVPVKKLIGRKRAIEEVVKNFLENYNGESAHVYICEADCRADAEYVKEQIEKAYKNIEVTIMPLGTIIVSHSGPGTLALFFTADKR